MADPITNAQFALGLFAPVAQQAERYNQQRFNLALRQADNDRKDALTYWMRKMDREDAEEERAFREQQGNKQIAANLAGMSEQTKRVLAQMDATEKRQRQAEVRKLYDEYSELTRDDAKALDAFGETEDEQFQNLAKEVGKLKQSVLMDNGMRRLFEEYGKLGGKQPLTDFGSTPAEQIQGLSKEIGGLTAKRARDRYANVTREIDASQKKIDEIEKLSEEDIRQAKAAGLNALSKDARAAFTQYRKTFGGNEDTALQKLSKLFPDDVDNYKERYNQYILGARANKAKDNKPLQQLYRNLGELGQVRSKLTYDLLDADPDAIKELTSTPEAVAPAPAKMTVSLGDLTGEKPTPEQSAAFRSPSAASDFAKALNPVNWAFPIRAAESYLYAPGSLRSAQAAQPPTPSAFRGITGDVIEAVPAPAPRSRPVMSEQVIRALQGQPQVPLTEYEKALRSDYVPDRTGPQVRGGGVWDWKYGFGR